MHVLILTHRFFPTYCAGTETLTLQIARGLISRGHQVTILTGEHDLSLPCSISPWLSVDKYDGLITHRLHYGTAEQGWNRKSFLGRLKIVTRLVSGNFDPVRLHINAPERIALVGSLLSKLKPDLVHLNHIIGFSASVIDTIKQLHIPVVFTPTDYFAVCPLSQLLRRSEFTPCDGPGKGIDCIRCMQPMPRVFALTAMWFANGLRSRRIISVIRSLGIRSKGIIDAINMADKILPSTKFLADILIRHGVKSNLIRVIPYGVDIGKLSPMNPLPKHFDNQAQMRLGFIGKLEKPKGLHVIFEALSLLKERASEVHLEVYAKIEENNSYQKILIRQSKRLSKSVTLLGTFASENIGKILRRFHALIIPSIWYESIPLVLRSSINAGIPVIVSKMGGLTEPLETDAIDFSFPAGDAQALCNILLQLLDNPIKLMVLRTHLKGKVRTLPHYLDDIETQYNSIIQ